MAQPINLKVKPIRQGAQGYFEQTFTSLDAAKADLVNLILTNKGERPMQPNFGTDIYKLLFENIFIYSMTSLKKNIIKKTQKWKSSY